MVSSLSCTRKIKRDHSSEFEENNNDATPWVCSTAMSLYHDQGLFHCYEFVPRSNGKDKEGKIKKVLTATRVKPQHNRLLLPSELVQNLVYIVLTDDEKSKLDYGKGTGIKFWDIDTNPMSLYSLVLKKWVYPWRNWNDDFFIRRELKNGLSTNFAPECVLSFFFCIGDLMVPGRDRSPERTASSKAGTYAIALLRWGYRQFRDYGDGEEGVELEGRDEREKEG
ncbi:hypothetical protein K1719_031959 [Acacia pycnantha]|nr:hypothetical protein K1719_031959 [Acacia pycnantha]